MSKAPKKTKQTKPDPASNVQRKIPVVDEDEETKDVDPAIIPPEEIPGDTVTAGDAMADERDAHVLANAADPTIVEPEISADGVVLKTGKSNGDYDNSGEWDITEQESESEIKPEEKTEQEPEPENKKVWTYPKVLCPYCETKNTRAYSTKNGRQYRQCRRSQCMRHFTVKGI